MISRGPQGDPFTPLRRRPKTLDNSKSGSDEARSWETVPGNLIWRKSWEVGMETLHTESAPALLQPSQLPCEVHSGGVEGLGLSISASLRLRRRPGRSAIGDASMASQAAGAHRGWILGNFLGKWEVEVEGTSGTAGQISKGTYLPPGLSA